MNGYLDFTRFHNRLHLKGVLTTETGLRVASGRNEGMTGADIVVVKDVLGRPFVPGASFKGVLRATAERLARTVDRRPDFWACDDPLDDRGRCLPARGPAASLSMTALRDEHGKDEAALTWAIAAASCTVCRTFGSPWLASKVLVRDLDLADPGAWVGRFQVRDGVGIDRDSGTSAEAVLYSYEVVPPGTAFTCELVIENVNDLELGLVLMALREFRRGLAPLGGGRSRGLGWVALGEWESIEAVDGADREALLDYLAGGLGTTLSQRDLDARLGQLREQLKGGR